MEYFLSKVADVQPETLELKRILPCVKFSEQSLCRKLRGGCFSSSVVQNQQLRNYIEAFTAKHLLIFFQTTRWSVPVLKTYFNKNIKTSPPSDSFKKLATKISQNLKPFLKPL